MARLALNLITKDGPRSSFVTRLAAGLDVAQTIVLAIASFGPASPLTFAAVSGLLRPYPAGLAR